MTRFEILRLWVEDNFPWLKVIEDKFPNTKDEYCLIELKDVNYRGMASMD